MLLDTASLDHRLREVERLEEFLAPYADAEQEVKQQEGGAPGARDRQQFVRSCVNVQAIFIERHLPSWPWRLGAQEEMDCVTRAEKGRRSAEAFHEWMDRMRLE